MKRCGCTQGLFYTGDAIRTRLGSELEAQSSNASGAGTILCRAPPAAAAWPTVRRCWAPWPSAITHTTRPCVAPHAQAASPVYVQVAVALNGQQFSNDSFQAILFDDPTLAVPPVPDAGPERGGTTVLIGVRGLVVDPLALPLLRVSFNDTVVVTATLVNASFVTLQTPAFPAGSRVPLGISLNGGAHFSSLNTSFFFYGAACVAMHLVLTIVRHASGVPRVFTVRPRSGRAGFITNVTVRGLFYYTGFAAVNLGGTRFVCTTTAADVAVCPVVFDAATLPLRVPISVTTDLDVNSNPVELYSTDNDTRLVYGVLATVGDGALP
jgi:hypothetical protein